MPESCQLNNEKDYSNSENKYNRNYYDLYCHCNTPHDQETIDEQKVYMIQCFTCEDWFHNTHLNPLGRNPTQTDEIEEKFILICRGCAKSKNRKSHIKDYQQYLHESIKKYLDSDPNEPPTKRQKIENPEVKALDPLPEDLDPLDIDIIIDDEFLEHLKDDQKPSF